MGLKRNKPTSDGQRQRIAIDFEELKDGDLSAKQRKDRQKKVRSLHTKIKKNSGHNNQGRITSRFRGGGAKPIYRKVDFLRSDKAGVPGRVDFIDYDPNRNSFIALVVYRDGEKRYIIAPKGVKPGTEIMSGAEAPIQDGNAMPLANMPLGSTIHCVELEPGRGAKIARSAGQYAQLTAKEKGMAALRMPSGETRWVLEECYATLGTVGNSDHSNRKDGKAGSLRWKGRKPHVRGSAMNPNDHKHGGGEGKCPIGAAGPYTAFGKKHGRKTRKKKKSSNKLIINRRK